jgi:2-hydroxy-3-keto-5-methylthiopentenyl-1-phosphate phosphatase
MIKQEILKDLIEIREKLDSIIETLEIMSDEELMESIKRVKEQPPKRDFEEFLRELGIDPLSMSD